MAGKPYLDFERINAAAVRALPGLVRRMLPDGRFQGAEWVARNPLRDDRRWGSFKINTHTGRWADFATGDRGGDVIGLVAYLRGLPRYEAALALKETLGVADA